MKKLIVLVVVVMSFGVVSTAGAFYGGINYMHTNVDTPLFGDYDLGMLAFKGGQELNDNFAFEGRFGVGVADDDGMAGLITVEADYFWGAYLRGGFRSGVANFYGLLGFAGVEVTASYSPLVGLPDETVDDTGASYGVGAEFMFNEKVGINFEYLILPEIEDSDVESINLGVSFQF